MTDQLHQFEETLGELQAHLAAMDAYHEREEKTYELSHPHFLAQAAVIRAEWKKLFPKTKFAWPKAYEAMPELRAAHLAENNALLEQQKAQHCALESKLYTLAQQLDVPKACLDKEEWLMSLSVSSSDYSSTGSGDLYAKCSAHIAGCEAAQHGLVWEIRVTRETPWEGKYESGVIRTYGCFVNTTPVGLEILKRKPGLSRRDWLKAVLKQGCNARVFNPWLPYEEEARLGLDYFGNDIQKAA